MSDLRALLEAPWLILTGWSVVLSLWYTAMAALALAAWRILWGGRSTSRAQYRAALVSLGAALVLSLAAPAVLTFAARPAATPPTTAPGSTTATDARPAMTSRAASQATTGLSEVRSGTSTPRSDLAVPAFGLGLLGVLWLIGVVTGLVRLLGGWTVAGRLGARAALVDEGPVRETFDHVRDQTHAGHARLAVSLEVEAPVAIGVTSPTVVVPGHLLDHLPPDSLAPILAHELAHVARHDYAANLAQCVAEVLLFHSPATWWLGRRIREAREFCCDDSAVAVAGDRARYVEALTLVARLGALTGARPVLGMAGPRLITRVRRLLEGEPTVTMPYARTAVIATLGVLLAAAMPRPFTAASAQLSARLFAAGAQDGRPVPIGFPQRQEGSALRIQRVESTDTHVCGTFDVQNVSSVGVAQVRFVGVLSFSSGANRPVQIFESDVTHVTIAPGATAKLDVQLVDVSTALREAAGGHAQVFCAVREVVHDNRITWRSATPNASARTAEDAMGNRPPMPSLPRALVGHTSAIAAARMTLCMDEDGDEYSPGAQVAIRDEPGSAARCTRDGQWVEVDARTGEPLVGHAIPSEGVVTLELVVAGLPSVMSLKGTYGTVATMQLPDGQRWGFVPVRGSGGDVDVALHDLTTNPHRLVGTRSLSPGQTATFDDVEPALSLRLTGQ